MKEDNGSVSTVAEIVGRLQREALLRDERGLDDALLSHPVADVCTDSRGVTPGAVFCAITGTTGDGHRFLAAAKERGAVLALVERRVETVPVPQLQVRDGRRAAAFAAAEAWGDPWQNLQLVGVTGTNGKTTTVAILRHLLGTERPAASLGTLGAIGTDGKPLPGTTGLTTPGPAEVARLLRRFVNAGAGAVAMEVSSHALEQDRVAAVRFDAAVFTNLSRDHLDYHASMDAYRLAKLRLLDLLKPGGIVVVNADDPAWQELPGSVEHLVRFGTGPQAQVRASDPRPSSGGIDWTLHTPEGAARVHLPLYGAFNLANALGAAAALWALGWATKRIAAGLQEVPQVPGRLERIAQLPGGAVVLVDYAHTPDALERALATLRPLTLGRLIVLFGAGGDRDPGKRPEMGRVAAAGADVVIVTSDNPRTEDPARIAGQIEAGMKGTPHLRELDRRKAIRRALELVGPGDIVLLAGKGHERYQIWGTEERPFDERLVVHEILAEQGVAA